MERASIAEPAVTDKPKRPNAPDRVVAAIQRACDLGFARDEILAVRSGFYGVTFDVRPEALRRVFKGQEAEMRRYSNEYQHYTVRVYDIEFDAMEPIKPVQAEPRKVVL